MATCALTGTAQAVVEGAAEATLVAGGYTILLTLTGDTWVATVGADNGITDALMAGCTSHLSEAAGWNAEIRDKMVFGDVTRNSNTLVTILLGAEAAYAITQQETVIATIPATAVTAAAEITASPGFGCQPTGYVTPVAMMMGAGT